MNVFDRLRVSWVQQRQGNEIRRHGWSGVYVGDHRSAPSWAYTIGFDESLDHPELVAFDLPKAVANELFWRSFEAARTRQLAIEDGLQAPFTDTRCVWRKVHPDHTGEWLTLACMRRFARTGMRVGLEAYQFVLSDRAGLLPWEPGYDERLRHLQRALWEAPRLPPEPKGNRCRRRAERCGCGGGRRVRGHARQFAGNER
ncbi:DUF4262 domain-containing protein [Phenylobacterium sp. LjRoot225]|uniref:DUF4262 domain-containing protein n=1 Tax=Phenylobacterium sp. LjRoot225 TaxID=3342285 RepID=UPI003ECFE164